jgi:hypothetical protein
MSQETHSELGNKTNNIDSSNNKEQVSLEDRFLELSETFRVKKEAYDKEVFETKTQIDQLKMEIEELEKREALEKELITREEEAEHTEQKEGDLQKAEEIMENIIENLSSKEVAVLETQMEKDTPLPNESDEVKTNVKSYLQNQMVKNLSGLKVPEKIKSTMRKSIKYFLTVGIISTLWATEINAKHDKGDNLNNKNNIDAPINNAGAKNKNNTYFAFAKTESGEYKTLPSGVQEVYSYAMENVHDSYIVIDKPSAEMYVFNSSNELITSMPVLLGKDKGEEPNRADASSPIASHATTPAGKFQLGKIGITDVNKDDSTLYQGRIISLLGSDNLALHMTYPGEYEKRTKALNTPTLEDKRMSWGCINISPKNFDKYIKPYFNKGNQNLFITPDDPTLVTSPVSGIVMRKGTPEVYSFRDTFNKNI